nr:NACHT domain-containing protein [Deinococcus marmoris]
MLGDPGAGKSTLLRAIALSSINADERLSEVRLPEFFPMYVELRRYSEFGSDEYDIEQYFCSIYGDSDFFSVMHWLLENGRVSILLDAFDEVPLELQGKVSDRIKEIQRKYPKCPLIVSSRIGNNRTIPSLSIFEIADFSYEERTSYINKWFESQNKSNQSQSLDNIINIQSGLDEITTNPLLLSLICILFTRDLEIPNRRAAIYRRCIDLLIREWDTERFFRRKGEFSGVDDEMKIRIISEIANYYMEIHERYAESRSIQPKVKEILDKYEIDATSVKDFLDEIFSHHGLIVRAGHGLYGFSHLTFQEYLTARYYVHNNLIKELIEKVKRDEKWKETFILAMGEVANAIGAIDIIHEDKKISVDSKLEYISTILSASKATIVPDDRVRVVDLVANLAYKALSRHEILQVNLTKDKADIIRLIRNSEKTSGAEYIGNSCEVFKIKGEFEFDHTTIYINECRKRSWFQGKIKELKIHTDGDIVKLIDLLLSDRRYYICEFFSHEYYILISEIDNGSDILDITDFIGQTEISIEEDPNSSIDVDWDR